MNRIRTNTKRISALLLAALLLAVLLPFGDTVHAETVALDSYFEDYNGKKIGGTWDEDTGTLTLIELTDVAGLNSRNMNNFIHHSFSSVYSDYETKLKKVVFDTDVVAGPQDCESLFVNCRSLTDIVGLKRLDTRHATSMESMFRGCIALRAADISNFRTENVTDISLMFTECGMLTSLDFSSFDTSKVTDTHQMFLDCKKLQSLDLHYFDTSSVTYMMGMFHNCQAMTSLNMTGWNTSKVKSFRVTFAGMKSMPSIDVSGFDTRSAEDMHSMFHTCSKVETFDLHHFDVSNVKDMTSMFQECASLTSVNVSGWNTSNNEKFYAMFGNCSSLPSLNVSGFDTSSGTDFGYMFYGCNKLNELDVTNFDTTKSTRNAHMFTECTELKKLSVGARFSNEVTSSTAIFPAAMYDSSTVNSNSPVKYAEEARVLSGAGVYVVGKEVTFNANGGTGTDQTQLFGYSLADKTLKSAADLGFANGSKAFLGWNTETNGSGTAYNTTDLYNYDTAPTGVLYAQWEATGTQTGPVISVGANLIVFEAGLPTGTGIGNTQTTASGQMTIYAPAGIDSIEIDGISVYLNGSLNVTTVSADCGELVVDFDASTGALSYTFILTRSVVAIGFPERRFTVRVRDADDRQAEAFISVGIEDDAPLAGDVNCWITVGEAAPITGNVMDMVRYGADGPAVIGFQWTDPSVAKYGVLTLGDDGTYSYALDNTNAAVLALAAGQTLTESFGYTVIDGDGDTVVARLVITIEGAPVQTKVKSTVHHHFWPIKQLSRAIAIGDGSVSTRSNELTLGGMIGSDFDVSVGEKLEITVQNLTLVGDVLRSLKGITIGEGATLAGYKPYEDTTKWIVLAIYCDNADFTDDATDAEHRLSFTVEDAPASGSTPTYPMHGVNTIDIYYVPAEVFSLTKIWADRDNAEDTRPAAVDMGIYTVAEADATENWMPAAGDVPTKVVTLKASEGWKADVALPASESGYTFVVRETEQERYRVIYEGDTENGFTITNVLKPGPFSLSYDTDGHGEVTDWMLRGDINGDQTVKSEEWQLLRDYLFDRYTGTDPIFEENADFCTDGTLEDSDWTCMRDFFMAALYPLSHLLPYEVSPGSNDSFDFRVVDTPKTGYHVSKITVNGHDLTVPQKGESAQTTKDGVTYTVAVEANGVATVTGLSLEKNDVRFAHAPDGAVLCTLTFILNGGTMDGQTGTVERKVAVGKTIQMPEPTRDGNTFLYWEGSVHYAGEDYTVEGDHTFRAQWEATATPTPTAAPTATPAPTAGPTNTPKPTNTPDKDTPRTSDDSHPLLWTVLLIGSTLGCMAILVAERRRVGR